MVSVLQTKAAPHNLKVDRKLVHISNFDELLSDIAAF